MAKLALALPGIVPHDVSDRRDKIGFVRLEDDWLLTLQDWIDRIPSGASEITYLNMVAVCREWGKLKPGSVGVIGWGGRWAETFTITA